MSPEEILGLCNRKNAIFVILGAVALYVHLSAAAHGIEPDHPDAVEDSEIPWCIGDEELSVFRSRCNDVENILSALADAFHV